MTTTLDRLNKQIADRGPRWHVGWKIRPDEYRGMYCITSADAEAIAAREEDDGCYQVRVTPPVEYADIAAEVRQIGVELRQLRAAEADVMSRAAAVAVTANDGGAGIAETTLAADLGVDRMTIRKWLGKRP
jgi:hypothetical protein